MYLTVFAKEHSDCGIQKWQNIVDAALGLLRRLWPPRKMGISGNDRLSIYFREGALATVAIHKAKYVGVALGLLRRLWPPRKNGNDLRFS